MAVVIQRNMGFLACVRKPYDPGELAAVVAGLLVPPVTAV